MAGNTKTVIRTVVKKLWDFPELSPTGNSRIFTKHFVNLTYSLNPNHLSLLSYLIYRSEIDNTIVYSSAVLLEYKQAVKLSQTRYGANTHLLTSLPNTRKYFIWLVENGLLLPTSADKQYLINPNLTYHKMYVKTNFYNRWLMQYNSLSVFTSDAEIKFAVQFWIDNVNKKF